MLCFSREHCGHRIIGVTLLFNVRMCPLGVKQFLKSPFQIRACAVPGSALAGVAAAFLLEPASVHSCPSAHRHY